jgi:flavin reductase (DIM6/NTAB) family NADH-FMN oxidoreductase RutF
VGAFDELLGELDYPMLIVTAAAGGERAGCLVGFATQTSIDPSRFLACISRANHTYRVACAADALAVHLVPAEAEALAALFGGETGDRADKFARVGWRDGPEGAPILTDCPNWFVGRVLDRLDTGDHAGFLLEPVAAEVRRPVDWFAFQRAKGITPGHEA